MPDNNKLELVVEVEGNKTNASIKSINTGLSSMEQAASKAARGASAGIDGLTVSMVKGATAGNLLADSIKKATRSTRARCDGRRARRRVGPASPRIGPLD